MRQLVLAGTMALVAFACPTADAGTVTYTSRSAWESAAGSFQTEDFNDGTLNSGITLDSDNGDVDTTTPDKFWDHPLSVGSQRTFWKFDGPIYAWGGTFDLFGLDGNGRGLGITHNGDGFNVANVPVSTSNGFVGFVSTVAFTQVLVQAGHPLVERGVVLVDGQIYTMDDMVYSAQAVPLPPAAWLGLGLLGSLGLLQRLRRRRRTLQLV